MTKMIVVRTRFDSQLKRFGQWPNEPKTINLLESGFVNELLMSLCIDHNRLVDVRISKTNKLKRKVLPGQVRGWYVLIYFS